VDRNCRSYNVSNVASLAWSQAQERPEQRRVRWNQDGDLAAPAAVAGTDWIPDDPVTVAARTLLPDWIRWNAEPDHLPPLLLDQALAATTDHPTG